MGQYEHVDLFGNPGAPPSSPAKRGRWIRRKTRQPCVRCLHEQYLQAQAGMAPGWRRQATVIWLDEEGEVGFCDPCARTAGYNPLKTKKRGRK